MIRNNSDPERTPPQPGQPRGAGYRSSMQELRREPTHCGPELVTAGPATAAVRQGLTRQGQESSVWLGAAGNAGQASGLGQAGTVNQAAATGEICASSRGCSAAQTRSVGRGSPKSQRESGREVGLTRGRSINGEDGRTGGEAAGSRSRCLELPRELLADPRDRGTETSVPAVRAPELDRRLKLSKPVRLVCREPEKDSNRDSEV